MKYEAQGHCIELDKLTRLYPAAIVEAGGEEAQVSLEWAQLKADVIPIKGYVLVFDFDPPTERPVNRVMLRFNDRSALDMAMAEVATLLK